MMNLNLSVSWPGMNILSDLFINPSLLILIHYIVIVLERYLYLLLEGSKKIKFSRANKVKICTILSKNQRKFRKLNNLIWLKHDCLGKRTCELE